MSRLTAAQVIAMGDYLEPDFDPASLTVSQLLGVLGYHNIKYPTPYSKPKLVTLFNEEIKTRTAKFKKERLKKENSIASEDGITDGRTGQPLAGTTKVPARRSSRRLSHAPVQPEESSVVLPDPPKRRRSSAQPSLGGPSRTIVPTHPVLAEESEPEEEELPVKKVGRRKKTSEAAGTHARRISAPAEDSGWEDNNIFQSGAESSSPVRPSPVRPKVVRKSVGPRKSRKSMSAPPQVKDVSSPFTSPHKEDGQHGAPQATIFKPELPSIMTEELRRLATPKFTRPPASATVPPSTKQESSDEEDLVDQLSDTHVLDDVQEEATQELLSEEFAEDGDTVPESQDDEQNAAISRRLAGDESTVEHYPLQPRSKLVTMLTNFFIMVFVVSGCFASYQYKQESSSIGYCDAGSNTNRRLEQLKARRLAIIACNRENRTHLWDSDQEWDELCPLLPLVPLPHPERCTPCPEHASCSQYSAACDTGFVLHAPWPLGMFPPPPQSSNMTLSLSSTPSEVIWNALSEMNGIPGLGSIAFPPRCLEDPKRKLHIGALGKAVETILGYERGSRVCAGGKYIQEPVSDVDGGEAKKWGVEVEKLRESMKKKTAPRLLPSFDDMFNEAIQELTQWGGVIIGEDREGHRYLAHKTPSLTWDCAITVKCREIWEEWRSTIFGIAVAVLTAFVARIRRAQKQIESKRVSELVQVALENLRNQEIAHHTDPVTAPQPYLSSLQLRDLVLQDEHSIPTRRRVWDQVERVVEGNANVRVNLEEIEGGDEMRVWRWVGSSGVRKQLE